ncbi:MAG: hypothetical protein HZB26_18430 [Candidatus Hydrogenedentes bacterium]|nr:hypothetical protein [Candidatus Hydrogenedentota bacterium]
MLSLVMCLVTAAFPANSTLVEAESFEIISGWTAGAVRAETATDGLSGGAALCANDPASVARKTITLAPGRYTVWVRSYDWGRIPGHYEFTVIINGQSRRMGVSEPPFDGFFWERWGEVDGGSCAVILSQPDAYASVVDALLFTPDGKFTPNEGTDLKSGGIELSGTDLSKEAIAKITLIPAADLPAPGKVLVALQSSRGALWQTTVPISGAEPWRASTPVRLPDITIPPQPFLWPGTYALKVGVPKSAWAAGGTVAELQKPEGAMPKPCSAEIRPFRGAPAIHINGKPEFAFAYLAAGGDFDKQYKQAADAGIRFFTMPVAIGNTPEGFKPSGCDSSFLDILKEQPGALMFPRIDVTAPPWWLAAHPGQAVVFDDGTTGPQSMFSQAWLNDACRWVEDYSRYIRSSPYADHVIGIHICSGFTGEWQAWGLWDEGKGERRGDFSDAAKAAWKNYLTKKYGTDAALAQAWAQSVTLDSAPIPTRQRRETKTGFFRMPPADQDIMDFYDFCWRGTSHAIAELAAAAKRGGGRDFLTGVFHGYQIQYGGKMQESQHNGMRELMDCPDLDFFCSPAMYSVREPGGTSTFMSFTESIQRRGKFWWHEADNRTYLAKDTLARATDQGETLNILKREFAHVIARQTGMWWFDMAGGWYDDPKILNLFKEMRQFAESNDGAWRPIPEVAVLVDDKSSYRLAPESPFLHDNVTQFLSRIPRLGAPYDTYLLSDLPTLRGYKLYIFPDAFDLTDAERAATESLRKDGKTLLFIGQAGIGRYADGRVTHDPALAKALLGFAPEGIEPKSVHLERGTLIWQPEKYPSIPELRDIANGAGVHLFSDTDDALYAGNGLVALHAQNEGAKTLHFKNNVHLTELFTDTPFDWTGTNLPITMKAKETRCYAVH